MPRSCAILIFQATPKVRRLPAPQSYPQERSVLLSGGHWAGEDSLSPRNSIMQPSYSWFLSTVCFAGPSCPDLLRFSWANIVVIWIRNVCHRLGHLNTWSPVDGAVWGGLGSEALMEEVHHWRQPSSVYSLAYFLFLPSCSLPWWIRIPLEPKPK